MSGEKPGDRAIIDRNTRDAMESGIPRDKARQMATDSMRRVDRKMRERGER